MVPIRSLVSLKSFCCAAAVLALCATQAVALAPRDHAHVHRHDHKAVASTYVSLGSAPAAVAAPEDTLWRTLDSNTQTAISIQESNHGDQHN